jgi:UDP-N-acetylenolpyruvoylglucosamine reductase
MLDKVNKVKAAIRKSMIEKNENSQPALSNQGSFFDNINL